MPLCCKQRYRNPIKGDHAGAIAAVREEIAILASDWNTTTGETVEQPLRNITRPEAKLHG